MKKLLTRIFWPILKFFETGQVPANYKKSHRIALNVLGGLFLFLSLVSTFGAIYTGQLAAFIPVVVFFSVGFVAVVVGILGSKGAVGKIWGTK